MIRVNHLEISYWSCGWVAVSLVSCIANQISVFRSFLWGAKNLNLDTLKSMRLFETIKKSMRFEGDLFLSSQRLLVRLNLAKGQGTMEFEVRQFHFSD
jgi:hypothetical protein